MIRKAEQMEYEIKESLRGGKGCVKMTTLLSPGEFKGKARLVARITIGPGCSIGPHVHEGEEEIFYILSGEADFDDNGQARRLRAGDVCLTVGGERHSIANAGDVPLDLLATILLY
ncbi:MAG: cupin domain-containing protein [Clostridia bacterium]|nr:cupin domain-containing protein [Clostridia bacterium]